MASEISLSLALHGHTDLKSPAVLTGKKLCAVFLLMLLIHLGWVSQHHSFVVAMQFPFANHQSC